MAEVLKSIGSMSDLSSKPSIEKTSYTTVNSTPIVVANEFVEAVAELVVDADAVVVVFVVDYYYLMMLFYFE